MRSIGAILFYGFRNRVFHLKTIELVSYSLFLVSLLHKQKRVHPDTSGLIYEEIVMVFPHIKFLVKAHKGLSLAIITQAFDIGEN